MINTFCSSFAKDGILSNSSFLVSAKTFPVSELTPRFGMSVDLFEMSEEGKGSSKERGRPGVIQGARKARGHPRSEEGQGSSKERGR